MPGHRASRELLVKICGITRPDDADVAVACGAQALGFVLWPKSPRFIDPHRARKIVATIPPFITTVGVFVNQTIEHVNGVANLVGLSAVQLHGDESLAFAEAIRRPVIKAIGLGAQAGSLSLTEWPERITLLLDAYDRDRRGGTGRLSDWARAADIAATRRVVLAGGLTPANVADAVARVKPFGIDVSSGVEVS